MSCTVDSTPGQVGRAGHSSTSTLCPGLSHAELGTVLLPSPALTAPRFSPQIPVAVLAARREGSQRCRCRQCLGRQGCLELAQLLPWPGLGCPWGQQPCAYQPQQEPGAISNLSLCCSWVFHFISVYCH